MKRTLIILALLLASGCATGGRTAREAVRFGPPPASTGYFVETQDSQVCYASVASGYGVRPIESGPLSKIQTTKLGNPGEPLALWHAQEPAAAVTKVAAGRGQRAQVDPKMCPWLAESASTPLPADGMTEEEFARELQAAVADENIVTERAPWRSILSAARWIGERCRVPGFGQRSIPSPFEETRAEAALRDWENGDDTALRAILLLLKSHQNSEAASEGGAGHHGQTLNDAIELLEIMLGGGDS